MPSANLQSFGPVAGGANSSAYRLPFTSYLTTTFQLWVSAGTATAKAQVSCDEGTTWTDVPSASTTSTTGVTVNYQGPLPLVRLNVAGTGNGFMNIAWGDNKGF